MKLYYNPLSTFSQKALIALYEKGVDFEREVVWLNDPESRAAFVQLYPIGKVPFMVGLEGRKVPESTIIIEYLENHFPQGMRLIPDDAHEARQARFYDRMADLYVNEQALKLFFDQIKLRAYMPEDLERARQFLDISYEAFDNKLATGPWVCGKNFTMADCALIPSLFYLERLLPFAERKNLTAYWERAKERPSYRKVMQEFVPVFEGMLNPA